jgi:hypothetical protein
MMNVLNSGSSGVYSNREEGILGSWDEYDEGLKVLIHGAGVPPEPVKYGVSVPIGFKGIGF